MRRIDQKFADLKAAQESGEYKLCPRCGRDTMKPWMYTNALSRIADIMVCDTCGKMEALLAAMNNQDTLYRWEAFQPVRPPSDFKDTPPNEAQSRIEQEQLANLTELFNRFLDGENHEELRLVAFESCPGLTELWLDPFCARYEVQSGFVMVMFRKAEQSIQAASVFIAG